MRKKVVCFDLDDTLYKEKSFLLSGFRKISNIIEERTEEKNVLSHMCQLWREGYDVFKAIEKEYPSIITKAEMINIYREHQPTIELDIEVVNMMTALKNRGCVIGLITDGRSISQRNKIEALGLKQWIDDEDIVISEEFGSEKPSKQNYLYFEEHYPNSRYYYIGDNPKKDFITPNKLGWETYGLRDVLGQNIHKCDIDNIATELKPHHMVDYVSSLIYEIVPPLENEYIVPIMEDICRDETQVGTGVIVCDYLLTAAHVFYNGGYEELQYRFDNLKHVLKLDKAIFNGHLNENRNGYSRDLILFKVNHKGSPFVLNKKEIRLNTICDSRAFHYELKKMRTDNLEGIKLLNESNEEKNCLLIGTSVSNIFHEGNSGCPIYKDYIIYGTLWKSHKSTNLHNGDYRYLFVDARYIADIIFRAENE